MLLGDRHLNEQKRIVCRLRYEGDKPDDDRVFVLGDRVVTLGRAAECDLVLNQESVSRAHARFSRDGDSWRITDLGSKNGVRVNAFRISQQKLSDGDRIDLGTTRLHVEIGPAPASAARADVVFSDRDARGLHTEIFEMSGLTSLLEPVEAGAPPPLAVSSPSQILDRPSERQSTRQAGDLPRLVSEAAGTLISCDSLDETLDRILALVFNNLPAERGVICLHDEDKRTTEPRATRTREGVPDEPILISSNIANHVIERRQALLVKDTQMDDRFGSAESVIMMQIHSAMCAPLCHEDRVVGFIYVDRQSDSVPFDTPHLHALSALAMLSAVAVEQAALRDSVRHEQELRSRLARYSSPAVVDRILRASGSAERGMVAEEGEITVLFADLTGFTSMAENLPSAEVIRILNRVLECLTEVVFALEGTLDKFRGDGMMAFFGAPLSMPDHAERAVEAALRMQESLSRLDSEPGSLQMRIGINSGPVVVGDVGSPQRKDYTVIGDVVNVASRLESSVAQPGQVVMGQATWEQVSARFRCQPLAGVQLKGKRQSVHPYLLLGRAGD